MLDRGIGVLVNLFQIDSGDFPVKDLDAILYPTQPKRPRRLNLDPTPRRDERRRSPIRYANLSGFPDLVVPAGFTGNRLPVGISFLGRAFSEARLLALGYAFEQLTRARRLPIPTPSIAGESNGQPD